MPLKSPSGITRRAAVSGLGAGLLAAACKAAPDSPDSPGAGIPQGWSMGDPLPFAVQEIYPCAHDGALHLAGGFVAADGRITGPTDQHHLWRPDGKGWRISAPLPAARHHPHLISWRGQLWAFGGFESPAPDAIWTMQASGWVFDATKGNWAPAPALPVPCAEAVMLVGGTGLLHLAGGRSPAGSANAAWQDQADQTHHFVLDDPRGPWRPAAPCLTARNSAAGGVISGQLHIVGGRSVAGGNTAAHEVYDAGEDRWRTAAPMPQAQGGLAAAELGGKLYAFGGEFFDNGGGVYPEAWAYDPATDTWSALEPMPHPRHGLGAVTLNGAIHVIGGALKASGVETSALVEIYRP
jgi:hypothetical protein